MRALLRAESLTKTVPFEGRELTILDGVSLEIKPGGQLAVVGESGSGKTTLLGLLAGLDVPTTGEIWIEGEEICQLPEEGRARIRATTIGFVFQTFQLIDSLTALENVMLPGELRGDASVRTDAAGYLERVGLAERLKHYPRQLSGGEQQRVAIARAFASRPRILLADEPTGNLDTITGQKVMDLLFDLNQASGTTLVLVTHDAKVASRCTDVLRLEAGKIAH